MRICRFDDNRLGIVSDNGVHDVSAALSKLPTWTYPLPNSGLREKQVTNSLTTPIPGRIMM
jgi:hypothetical protein